MEIKLEGATPLFFVFDVPTSVAFYRDILGFEVVHTSKPFSDVKDDYGWAMLQRDGIELMLNNAYEDNIRPTAPDPARIAAHADTIFYIGCRDVDGMFGYLRSSGIVADPPKITYYGMKQVYLKDPDGYGLCFQWPALPS